MNITCDNYHSLTRIVKAFKTLTFSQDIESEFTLNHIIFESSKTTVYEASKVVQGSLFYQTPKKYAVKEIKKVLT